MTDDGAAFPPGPAETPALFRRRGLYLGYRAFGDSTGTVLIDPRVARELRSAAEFATQEQRFTGGLLYGRRWTDDEGGYLVVSGFLDAGPREGGGDWVPAGSSGAGDLTGGFTLTDARLRLLRDEAARMYSTSLEVGWWRTLPGLGDFGPADLVTQAELVAAGGVGLLVYGSGQHWGTAYLGPDGHAPDSAGTLVAADEDEPDTGPGAGHPGAGTGPGNAAAHATRPGNPEPYGAGTGSGPAPHEAGPYDTGPYDTGPYEPGPDDTGPDNTGPDNTGPDNTGPGDTDLYDTGPYDTRPYATGPDDTAPGDSGPYDTGPYDTGPYDTGPGDSGPYDTGQYDTAPDDLVLDDTPLIDAAAASAAQRRPGDGGRPGEPVTPGQPSPGTAVATRRPALLTRRPAGAVEFSSRDWYQRPPEAGFAGPRIPGDAKVVIVLALLAFAGAAVLIGVLMSSALIAVIVAVVCVLVVFGFVWMSHL